MNKARIKLAEALDVCPSEHSYMDNETWNKWDKCKKCGVRSEDSHRFDPLTDANDDYDVLRFVRGDGRADKKYGLYWADFMGVMQDSDYPWIHDYEVGDYARAACKVLGIEVLA